LLSPESSKIIATIIDVKTNNGRGGQMKKLSIIAAIILLSSTLAMTGCTNREMGTVGGATVGGLIGYGVGGGTGAAVGAVGGGLVGHAVTR
jgi:osmotically inducible lipoprotein OsmB